MLDVSPAPHQERRFPVSLSADQLPSGSKDRQPLPCSSPPTQKAPSPCFMTSSCSLSLLTLHQGTKGQAAKQPTPGQSEQQCSGCVFLPRQGTWSPSRETGSWAPKHHPTSNIHVKL